MIELPSWIEKELLEWAEAKKYGYIQLNMQAGKIVNINKHETVKPEGS